MLIRRNYGERPRGSRVEPPKRIELLTYALRVARRKSHCAPRRLGEPSGVRDGWSVSWPLAAGVAADAACGNTRRRPSTRSILQVPWMIRTSTLAGFRALPPPRFGSRRLSL